MVFSRSNIIYDPPLFYKKQLRFAGEMVLDKGKKAEYNVPNPKGKDGEE